MFAKNTADTPVYMSAKRLWRNRPKRKKFKASDSCKIQVINPPLMGKSLESVNYTRPPNTTSNQLLLQNTNPSFRPNLANSILNFLLTNGSS